MAKTIHLLLAGARHPTPAESAYLEPVLREQVDRLGLGWMPWLLVGQGFTAEAGQAFARSSSSARSTRKIARGTS